MPVGQVIKVRVFLKILTQNKQNMISTNKFFSAIEIRWRESHELARLLDFLRNIPDEFIQTDIYQIMSVKDTNILWDDLRSLDDLLVKETKKNTYVLTKLGKECKAFVQSVSDSTILEEAKKI